ncbi:hypothetical protein PHYPSEUDO_007569 [Phytophthora pseudosyringae]|uniref:Uncharacterized protein n=1 Tax=Phytophthora pseudosyringae TaxID=221518 RepID=A0A8T1VJJ5_9STRA|nr:hypothetical protein PHYPSEUDO_007569 [Phytophthora pseudosyringae]
MLLWSARGLLRQTLEFKSLLERKGSTASRGHYSTFLTTVGANEGCSGVAHPKPQAITSLERSSVCLLVFIAQFQRQCAWGWSCISRYMSIDHLAAHDVKVQ